MVVYLHSDDLGLTTADVREVEDVCGDLHVWHGHVGSKTQADLRTTHQLQGETEWYAVQNVVNLKSSMVACHGSGVDLTHACIRLI